MQIKKWFDGDRQLYTVKLTINKINIKIKLIWLTGLNSKYLTDKINWNETNNLNKNEN